MTRNTLIAVIALMGPLITAFGQDEAPVPPNPLETPSPKGARVYIQGLKDGKTVKGPVTIRFGLKGMGVCPAGTYLVSDFKWVRSQRETRHEESADGGSAGGSSSRRPRLSSPSVSLFFPLPICLPSSSNARNSALDPFSSRRCRWIPKGTRIRVPAYNYRPTDADKLKNTLRKLGVAGMLCCVALLRCFDRWVSSAP